MASAPGAVADGAAREVLGPELAPLGADVPPLLELLEEPLLEPLELPPEELPFPAPLEDPLLTDPLEDPYLTDPLEDRC